MSNEREKEAIWYDLDCRKDGLSLQNANRLIKALSLIKAKNEKAYEIATDRIEYYDTSYLKKAKGLMIDPKDPLYEGLVFVVVSGNCSVFTFLHEIAHVVLGHKTHKRFSNLKEANRQEQQANEQAEKWLKGR
jgi:hypothetical protein